MLNQPMETETESEMDAETEFNDDDFANENQ